MDGALQSPRTAANTLSNSRIGSETDAAIDLPSDDGLPVHSSTTGSNILASVQQQRVGAVGGADWEGESADESVRILFTGGVAKDDFEALAGKIGATVVDDPRTASHVVTCPDLKRTPKLLVALNSGVRFVVQPSWLTDSAKKGAPLPISSLKSKYIVRDRKKEALWGFSMEATLSVPRGPRGRGSAVFQGYGFCYQVEGVTEEKVPSEAEMRPIVESGGGQWLASTDWEAEGGLSAPMVIVTCQEAVKKAKPPFARLLAAARDEQTVGGKDKEGLEGAGKRIMGVFGIDLVFLAVLRQQIDFESSRMDVPSTVSVLSAKASRRRT